MQYKVVLNATEVSLILDALEDESEAFAGEDPQGKEFLELRKQFLTLKANGVVYGPS